jgi:TM2 domain-containing membrane protein YozV
MNCANHPEREQAAFCQNCGKPVCNECMRQVGQAVFCEPCLAAKLNTPPAPAAGTVDYTVSGAIPVPPPPPPGSPNPVLAAILGFIPGVGAMYNGQFAKGIVHLIVFAVLVSLSDSHGIFGLFVAGWEFYMAFEAYHTAKARRDGDPLPNPFGLNDLGERMGFGKSWGVTANVYTGGPVPTAVNPVPPPPAPEPVQYAQANVPPPPPSYSGYAGYSSYGVPPIPPIPPIPPMPSFTDAQMLIEADKHRSNFPAGAVVLVALGVIFLLGNTFHRVWSYEWWPFILIALGVWLTIRKMTNIGISMHDDGTATHRWNIIRCLRGSGFLILIGVMGLLDTTHVLPWRHSWPLFLLYWGGFALLERAAYHAAAAEGFSRPVAATPTAVPNDTQHDSAHDDAQGR